MRHFHFIFILLASLTTNALADAKGWSEYRTDNFIYYSDIDEKEVKQYLHKLEIFRAAMLDILQLDQTKTLPPVKVYAFKSQNDFDKISPTDVAGYFQNNIRGPLMVISPKKNALNITFHEYIHYLARAIGSAMYPTWYSEGVAEFYSTMQIKPDHIVIGNTLGRLTSKNAGSKLTKLDKLFSQSGTANIGTKAKTSKFYANSWLLVHFFILGEINDQTNYKTELMKFLALQNQGMEWQEAFDNSFSISLKELENKITRYNRKRVFYGRKLPLPQTQFEYVKTNIDEGEMYATYSHLAFSSRKQIISDDFLQKALAQNSSLALSVQALLTGRKGKIEEAEELANKALEKKPVQAETLVTIGQTYKELAKKSSVNTEKFNRLAIYYLQRATSLSFSPAAYDYLADIYWRQDEKQKAINAISKLIDSMPSNTYANMLAGDYLLRVNEVDKAEYFINNVLNWSPNTFEIKKATELLTKIQEKRLEIIQ